MNPEEKLRHAIELHSQVLHSETQAISARDLSTIEDILAKKDESLEILLSAKEDLGLDYETSNDLMQLFEQIGRAHVWTQSHSDLVCRLLLEKKKKQKLKKQQKKTKKKSNHMIKLILIIEFHIIK